MKDSRRKTTSEERQQEFIMKINTVIDNTWRLRQLIIPTPKKDNILSQLKMSLSPVIVH